MFYITAVCYIHHVFCGIFPQPCLVLTLGGIKQTMFTIPPVSDQAKLYLTIFLGDNNNNNNNNNNRHTQSLGSDTYCITVLPPPGWGRGVCWVFRGSSTSVCIYHVLVYIVYRVSWVIWKYGCYCGILYLSKILSPINFYYPCLISGWFVVDLRGLILLLVSLISLTIWINNRYSDIYDISLLKTYPSPTLPS